MLLRLLTLPSGRLASLFPSSLLGALASTGLPLDLQWAGRGGITELAALGAACLGSDPLSRFHSFLAVNQADLAALFIGYIAVVRQSGDTACLWLVVLCALLEALNAVGCSQGAVDNC